MSLSYSQLNVFEIIITSSTILTFLIYLYSRFYVKSSTNILKNAFRNVALINATALLLISTITNIDASKLDPFSLYIIVIVSVYVITIIISLMAYQKGRRQYQQQIEDLDKNNEQLIADLSKVGDVDLYGPIQIQLNEMKGYYIFAKRQAIVSSIISIAGIVIGVVIMAIFVITTFFFKSTDISISYLTGILAAITELIGGLAFTFNSQASKKMDRYFESLKKLQNVILAVDLLNKYFDEERRQRKLDKIIDNLMEYKSEKNKEEN
ncbi:hypothetical protein KSF_089480 [Reticulibacter mediterranei]|uniref:Uncharacterized protein n=1 Tax=Reticulibacter mediterranei TaxID=2778369 RepID=A0A8J3IUT7_9CHLR|nr:hypothetical protein [Reticulibacter mediterranei]GHO98900.1 hypothetical protein KSF_089480 [Reticulibacter mediterranei]